MRDLCSNIRASHFQDRTNTQLDMTVVVSEVSTAFKSLISLWKPFSSIVKNCRIEPLVEHRVLQLSEFLRWPCQKILFLLTREDLLFVSLHCCFGPQPFQWPPQCSVSGFQTGSIVVFEDDIDLVPGSGDIRIVDSVQ